MELAPLRVKPRLVELARQDVELKSSELLAIVTEDGIFGDDDFAFGRQGEEPHSDHRLDVEPDSGRAVATLDPPASFAKRTMLSKMSLSVAI
ncbi:hypothetical protein GCM10007147_35990 [Nocardiopsis kunsanensis]|uniref:Uncharacterized protein n=1 Tax=Nocardiopsis kunsanensis TaxID=141693 RepID=A0A918XIN5_9ACTN|nr:hypothetical protein GCM10007147_35990 [Nocardiopsis kunsanensis]